MPAALEPERRSPGLPVRRLLKAATEDEDEASGAGSPARRRRAKSDKRSVGFAFPRVTWAC